MLHQFVRQPVERILIGYGALTCGYYYEHVIFVNLFCQFGQFVPVGHKRVFCPYVSMVIVDIFPDEFQRFLASMELDPAIQVAGHSCQSLQPAVETRFELCSAGHYNLNASQRIERLYKTRQDNLAVQTVVQTLYEVAPELGVDLCMDMHTHNDFRGGKLAESVLDTIGNIGCQSYLSLHPYLYRTGSLLQHLQ